MSHQIRKKTKMNVMKWWKKKPRFDCDCYASDRKWQANVYGLAKMVYTLIFENDWTREMKNGKSIHNLNANHLTCENEHKSDELNEKNACNIHIYHVIDIDVCMYGKMLGFIFICLVFNW